MFYFAPVLYVNSLPTHCKVSYLGIAFVFHFFPATGRVINELVLEVSNYDLLWDVARLNNKMKCDPFGSQQG